MALLWTPRGPFLFCTQDPSTGHRPPERAEGQNPLPGTVGPAAFDAAQDTMGFLGCKHVLLSHIQFFIDQHPQSALTLVMALTHVLDLALGLYEFHEVNNTEQLHQHKLSERERDSNPSLSSAPTLSQQAHDRGNLFVSAVHVGTLGQGA